MLPPPSPGDRQRVTAANRPGSKPEGAAPGWKVGLALVSLALSLLLWLNGLIDSLSRPSVGSDLNRRQLELTVLAAPNLKGALRPLLSDGNPLQTLQKALEEERNRAAEDGTAIDPDLNLELALVLLRQNQPEQARPLLKALAQGQGPNAALAERLLGGSSSESIPPQTAANSLLRLWSCEALAPGGGDRCGATALRRRATWQLLAVSAAPVVLLVLGSAALLRELWLRWRGRATEAPPLLGPVLGGVDAVLLIAGGFVVVGELLTPLLVAPLLTALLQGLAITSPLREGVTVVGLYLALMTGPLVILALLLRGQGAAALQFRWAPGTRSLRSALKGFLMVLPLVSLVGWLQGQLWGDAGGSNPLLELVLNSHNVPALACFGFTAIVLAPLFEETIFRGALLPVAARRLGPLGGVLLSALIFAVAHLSLGELLPLLVLGIGLGWLRWSGGRLGSCVLMHALWNALTFTNLVLLGWS